MTETTQHLDPLTSPLTTPSLSAQYLTACADLIAAISAEPLTVRVIGRALAHAHDEVLTHHPKSVQAAVCVVVCSALPQLALADAGITRGEYALRLRTTARGL